jgi:hypothetical protein
MGNPNGGNTLTVSDHDDTGDRYNITWTTKGYIPQVKLAYDTDSGDNEYDLTINGGQALTNIDAYNWEVPPAIGAAVRVKVMSAANPTIISCTSESDFEIIGQIKVTAPTASTINANAWKVHSADKPSSHLIQWKNFGDMGTVNIYYSSNGGSAYTLLITGSGDNGPQSYSWEKPRSLRSKGSWN